MAHVVLIGNLKQYTGGVTELDIAAASVRQLFSTGTSRPTNRHPVHVTGHRPRVRDRRLWHTRQVH